MTDPHVFRLLDIDESSFRYTLIAYQLGLRGALTYWLARSTTSLAGTRAFRLSGRHERCRVNQNW
jgi:hypothetical protein